MTIRELIDRLEKRAKEDVGYNAQVILHCERDVMANYYDITQVFVSDEGEVTIDADYIFIKN